LAVIEELNISIGQIPLRLRIPEKALFEQASARYAQFLSVSPHALPISLRACELAEMTARFAGVKNPVSAWHQQPRSASAARAFIPAQLVQIAAAHAG